MRQVENGSFQLKICTDRKTGKKFSKALEKLHYAGNCHPIGRFLRLLLFDDEDWIGGLILRSPLPMIHCRDEYFDINRYKHGGRIPKGESPYWQKLNRLVNMARAFVFEEYQRRGYGTKMMSLIESQGLKVWKTRYGFEPSGIDCLDVAPPKRAKIFLQNGWEFIGRTKGYTHSRGCKTGKVKNLENPIEGRMKKSSSSWYVYARKL